MKLIQIASFALVASAFETAPSAGDANLDPTPAPSSIGGGGATLGSIDNS